MKLKQTIAKLSILVVSISIGVVLCEAGSRLALNSSDYLSVKTIRDNVLGITIAPNSSGFDEWGFRNRGVPSIADIVAVGDSHTFGNTAAMNDSWPSVVARATGSEVYNLGLGGYGPNQYYHLLTTKGFKLHPKWVICGLYMGDDFENAFSVTYGLDHWSFLRNGLWDNVNADIWGTSEPPVWGAGVRNWLSEHSMVYRLVFHGPLLAMVKESVRLKQVSTDRDPYTTALVVEDQNIREAFRPIEMVARLDQSSGPVREGMRITFHLLKEMDGACRQEGCKLLVVIIPTKETVFSEYLENHPKLHLHEALDRVIVNERSARKTLLEFLVGAGIAHLDTLPALKESVGNQLYAQTTRDMHPGKNGYRVIGEAVAEHLKRVGSGE
jgi:hypothetical protein